MSVLFSCRFAQFNFKLKTIWKKSVAAVVSSILYTLVIIVKMDFNAQELNVMVMQYILFTE